MSNDEEKKLEMQYLQEAQARYADELMQIPGVHGIGIGFREVNGELTEEVVLVVRVYKKLPQEEVGSLELIPSEFVFSSASAEDEVTVATDVQERGRPVPYPHIANGDLENHVRPIPGGYWIGEHFGSSGTLGGWVWDNDTEQTVLISNNHVLGSTVGSDVIQPGNGAWPADHMADIVRTGTLDATIAEPVDGDDVTLGIEGIGPAVYEIAEPTLGMLVEKSGMKTEHTHGFVSLVNYIHTPPHYGSTNDFEVWTSDPSKRFAYYGDSGSLIVERNHPEEQEWKRVVGLLWGGDPDVYNCYGHKISDVFADLNLTTVCAGAINAFFDELFSSFSAASLPARMFAAPFARRLPERRFFDGIARDFEKQMMESRYGREIVFAVHRDRIGIVNLLHNREVLRALAATAGPLIKGAVTTDEVLDREIPGESVERFYGLLKTAQRAQPKLERSFELAEKLAQEAEGRTIRQILNGE